MNSKMKRVVNGSLGAALAASMTIPASLAFAEEAEKETDKVVSGAQSEENAPIEETKTEETQTESGSTDSGSSESGDVSSETSQGSESEAPESEILVADEESEAASSAESEKTESAETKKAATRSVTATTFEKTEDGVVTIGGIASEAKVRVSIINSEGETVAQKFSVATYLLIFTGIDTGDYTYTVETASLFSSDWKLAKSESFSIRHAVKDVIATVNPYYDCLTGAATFTGHVFSGHKVEIEVDGQIVTATANKVGNFTTTVKGLSYNKHMSYTIRDVTDPSNKSYTGEIRVDTGLAVSKVKQTGHTTFSVTGNKHILTSVEIRGTEGIMDIKTLGNAVGNDDWSMDFTLYPGALAQPFVVQEVVGLDTCNVIFSMQADAIVGEQVITPVFEGDARPELDGKKVIVEYKVTNPYGQAAPSGSYETTMHYDADSKEITIDPITIDYKEGEVYTTDSVELKVYLPEVSGGEISLGDGSTLAQTYTSASAETLVPVINYDADAPETPEITSPSRWGTVSSDDVTITGTAEPGMTVKVEIDQAEPVEVTADSNGKWELVVSGLDNGEHKVSVVANDGFEDSEAAGLTFYRDYYAAPVIVFDNEAPVFEYGEEKIAVTGHVVGGSHEITKITAKLEGQSITRTIRLDADGNFNFTFPNNKGAGDYELTVTVLDNYTPIEKKAKSVVATNQVGSDQVRGTTSRSINVTVNPLAPDTQPIEAPALPTAPAPTDPEPTDPTDPANPDRPNESEDADGGNDEQYSDADNDRLEPNDELDDVVVSDPTDNDKVNAGGTVTGESDSSAIDEATVDDETIATEDTDLPFTGADVAPAAGIGALLAAAGAALAAIIRRRRK
ncbi:MAG: Ig-like domain-containing protein [Propionibacteriaceae bacterium]|jgi:hypothetical protein|nr:Ig-like domain-containing protein [Propionibacteriaceae bacterium]